MGKEKIGSPEPIDGSHQLESFDSGEAALDRWLKERALDNHNNNASKTFVVHQDKRVIGYYCLATGSVTMQNAPRKIKRNMPNPIPVMVLGRLAVDKIWQGTGMGRGLLKDAVFRTIQVSQHAGIKALLVHAISESAKRFYKQYGFIESLLEPMTLMLPLDSDKGRLG